MAFGGGFDLLRAIRSASVSSVLSDGSSLSGFVGRARSLPSSGSAAETALVYSSSKMISLAPSRSETSLICGPENSLLSRMSFAPTLAAP